MQVKIMSEMNAVAHSYKQDIPSCVIVSITGANDEVPMFYRPNELHKGDVKVKGVFDMHFEDIDKFYEGYKEPRAEDFVGLKAFIDKHKNKIDEIIVHCHAGISRSSGCASAICQYLEICDKFIWSDGNYIPNRLVHRLAREEFGLLTSEDDLIALFKMNDDIHMELAEQYKDVYDIWS